MDQNKLLKVLLYCKDHLKHPEYKPTIYYNDNITFMGQTLPTSKQILEEANYRAEQIRKYEESMEFIKETIKELQYEPRFGLK